MIQRIFYCMAQAHASATTWLWLYPGKIVLNAFTHYITYIIYYIHTYVCTAALYIYVSPQIWPQPSYNIKTYLFNSDLQWFGKIFLNSRVFVLASRRNSCCARSTRILYLVSCYTPHIVHNCNNNNKHVFYSNVE